MDKQREMFEKWYGKHCEPGVGPWFVRDKDNSDEYYMSHTQTAWDAWQAAIAAVKQQVPLSMRDPLSQASLVVQEWNEGAADQEEWGNEACQAIFALSNCINTLLIEAGTKTQAAIAAQWQPIDTLPVKQLLATREMFIVRGFGVEGVSIMPYTTDAYAVWLESDCGCHYKFARWKHNFQPTHWMPLPPEPAK